jgi:cysteine desulfurase
MDSIYLDNNATTQLLPEVADAMREAYRSGFGNPASQHEPGRRARRLVEDCRDRIAEILGACTSGNEADRVVFTSGGTEANNLAVHGLTQATSSRTSGTAAQRLLISAVEHPSVAVAAAGLRRAGWQVDLLAVDAQGIARVDCVPEFLRSGTRFVSLMLGNNETGVLQPVRQVADHCRAAGVPCHSDAVQAVGKVPVSFRELGVDALTCTAHKLHGPNGIGALILRKGVRITPLLHGGFQQAGLRPGTESVALVAGFCQALESWHRERQDRAIKLAALRDRLEAAIVQGYPDAVIVGKGAPRLPHTSNIAFVGLDRQALQMALDLAGVACSTGSACASGSSDPSPVLLAMGCEERVVRGSLRFSMSILSTSAEVELAAERILLACRKLCPR